MPRRIALALAAAALVVLVVAIVIVSRPVPPPPTPTPSSPIVTSPSPSPTPTASGSPSPTPVPTPTPTPRPPAAIIADTWRSVRSYYPWMPDVAVRVQPVPEGESAYYVGVENGVAVIAVKPLADLGTDDWVAWHEAGHAALDVASRLSHTSTDDLLTAYWGLRGFPGTWSEQQRKAEAAVAAGQTGFGVHQMWPQEMFADTFASAHVDSFPDGTVFPLIPYDRAGMRAFYATLPYYLPRQLVTHALGSLGGSGQWTFTNRVASFTPPPGGTRPPALGEVWATQTASAFSRYVCTYLTDLGPALPDTNELSRQLSPDGKRMVLSVGVVGTNRTRYALAVVDLETGASRIVTPDPAYHDVSPAWSPDGARIAFARWSAPSPMTDAGVWTIAPDGAGLLRVVPPSTAGQQVVHGWTADGSAFGYGVAGVDGRYRVADPGAHTDVALVGYLVSRGDWRARSPAFVGAFSDAPLGPAHLDVADAAGAQRVVLPPGEVDFANARPRWRPGTDEFLYLFGSPASAIAVATVTGQVRTPATRGAVAAAAWTSAGDIVYVAEDSPSTATFRIMRADGSGARDLATVTRPLATWRETYRDVASVTYR